MLYESKNFSFVFVKCYETFRCSLDHVSWDDIKKFHFVKLTGIWQIFPLINITTKKDINSEKKFSNNTANFPWNELNKPILIYFLGYGPALDRKMYNCSYCDYSGKKADWLLHLRNYHEADKNLVRNVFLSPLLGKRLFFRNLHHTLTIPHFLFPKLWWKFQDFSVTQILREINFGQSRSSKTAIFAFFEGPNFVKLVNFSLQKVHYFIKSRIQKLQMC